MSRQNIKTDIEKILHYIFNDETIVYDHSRFAGGLTNYNYFIKINDTEYIVREPGVSTEFMINRHSENMNNDIASDLKINSECIYFDSSTGIKISRRVPNAENFAGLNPSSTSCMNSVADLIKLLHKSNTIFQNKFEWNRELEKYEQIVRSLKGSLFFNYSQKKYQLLDFIALHVKHFYNVPCHNDTVPENFLMDTCSKKSFLIDWEYSGMNDPSWDVAMYILESKLPKEAIPKFLEAYYGTADPGKDEILKLKCMCMAQDLLWSIWGVIRHYSGEDFLEYLNMRYDRFSDNLSALTKDADYPLSAMIK